MCTNNAKIIIFSPEDWEAWAMFTLPGDVNISFMFKYLGNDYY